jgi:predicted DNA-binding transcriptional regulator AlpA
MRRELENALLLARSLPPHDLPAFLGAVEEIRVTALTRLTSPPSVPTEDRLLDVAETAKRLNCSEDWLYRNSKKLPFARPHAVGGKLLFSSLGLDAYLRAKR